MSIPDRIPDDAGLSTKNAILIIQFIKEQLRHGRN